jgi:hypothetical protein
VQPSRARTRVLVSKPKQVVDSMKKKQANSPRVLASVSPYFRGLLPAVSQFPGFVYRLSPGT